MKTIGVAPEKLTRKEFVDWFASIGIDADHLKAIEITRDAIDATFYARNDDDNFFVDDNDEIVTHTIHIPVDEIR